jgi:hypothetical protein
LPHLLCGGFFFFLFIFADLPNWHSIIL